MAHWTGEPDPMPFPALVGEGRFVITIDPREGGQRYQGIVSLEGDTVSAALENYLTRSEQLDSRIWLAADTQHAAGMLLQRLPDRHDEDADTWNRATHLGATLTRDELLSLPAPEIIRRLYHEEDVRVFDRENMRFHCGCSRERVANVLRMLGYDEVQSILHERARSTSTVNSATTTTPSTGSIPSSCLPPSRPRRRRRRATEPIPIRHPT